MTATTSLSRYSLPSIALHWLMLLLLAAVYACIELRELFPRGSDWRGLLKTWHYMLGLSVLALVAVRILFRLLTRAPAALPGTPAWQHWLATVVHLALYGLMIAMPLLGWLMLSAEGDAIPFFGLQLPPLIGSDRGLAHEIEDIHEAIGTAGYYLIGAHAAAALFHHYVLRDGTLRRMLPWTARRG